MLTVANVSKHTKNVLCLKLIQICRLHYRCKGGGWKLVTSYWGVQSCVTNVTRVGVIFLPKIAHVVQSRLMTASLALAM